MQILWIKSDYVDPPDTGGKIRTYNLLREINRICPVTYVSLWSKGSTATVKSSDWASRIEAYPHSEEKKSGVLFALRVLAGMFSEKPYIVQKYKCPEIRDSQYRLTSESGQASAGGAVLVCDFLEMVGNVNWGLPCPKLLFQHNVEHIIWRRYFENEQNLLKKFYFWFEHWRMKRYERQACNRFDLILAVSPQDKDVMQQLGVHTPIEIVETGVDTTFFAPRHDVRVVPGRLLFLGSLDWMPNIDGIKWFVQDIYPRIRQACPTVSLDIVGRRPTAEIQALVSESESVRVFGSVPDVRPHISEADVFVVPLRIGSGTRLKIFEAMAMQKPVVSTTIGAEGLPIEHDRHLLLADSPEDYADAVVSLVQNPVRNKALASAGHELVRGKYSWTSVGAKLHEVCRRLYQEHEAKVSLA